ncbi:hypothetical protein LINPERPRIM_LOCUS19267 [Linum perenne]
METAKCHSIMSFKIVLLLLLSLVHVLSINGMASNDDMQLDPSSILKTIVVFVLFYSVEAKSISKRIGNKRMHQKSPMPRYNHNFFIFFKFEDLKTSNWWLYFQDEQVGYWPGSLFRNLRTSASLLEWGGEIINKNKNGLHTDTQMGSGHFPSEGYSKAAYFRSLEYVDGGGYDNPADGLTGHASRPECYDIDVRNPAGEFGVHFFFGGPGFSNDCY